MQLLPNRQFPMKITVWNFFMNNMLVENCNFHNLNSDIVLALQLHNAQANPFSLSNKKGLLCEHSFESQTFFIVQRFT